MELLKITKLIIWDEAPIITKINVLYDSGSTTVIQKPS